MSYAEIDPDAVVGQPAEIPDLIRVARATPGGLSEGEVVLLRELTDPMSAPAEDRNEAVRQHVLANKAPMMALFFKLICLVTAPAQQLAVLELFSICLLEESTNPATPTAGPLLQTLVQLLATQPGGPLEAFKRFLVDASPKADVLSHALAILATLHVARKDAPEAAALTINRAIAAMGANRSVAFHAAGARAASILMQYHPYRRSFVEQGGVPPLLALTTQHPTNVQLTYEAGVAVWLLSFVPAVQRVLQEHHAIRKVHEVLRIYRKDKCARIALLTLKNFVVTQQRAEHGGVVMDEWLEGPTARPLTAGEIAVKRATPPPNYFGEMVQIGVPRTLAMLSKRNFGDEDIAGLVSELLAVLEKMVDDVSSFAEYKSEVLSGRLEWSPVHKSEKFWKENIARFEEEDFKVLRELALLLKESTDPTTQEIALHDFGEFVRLHPLGRRVVSTVLNVKTRIMELMASPHKDVSKAALACTQKILVQKWEFLS